MPDEPAAIARSSTPVTTTSLTADLARLGDLRGRVVIVHTSMSALGWVAGGAPAVVHALRAAVGPEGTLVVPTHSAHLSDPARWSNPPVPESWWDVIRAEMTPYDPRLTPTREMGAVVECFRHLDGVLRSGHPCHSFAAVGPSAADVVAGQRLDEAMDDGSPLAHIYDLDGLVLLLGVGHANNTSLHLAENRAVWPTKARVAQGSPMTVDGERRWVTYEELDYDDDDFERIGDDFAAQAVGQAGSGTARLMSQRAVVDFAVSWISDRRTTPSP